MATLRKPGGFLLSLLLLEAVIWSSTTLLAARAFSSPSDNFAYHHRSLLCNVHHQRRTPITTSLLNAVSKTRDDELARLSQHLDIPPSKVRDLLLKQRQKLKGSDDQAKVRHIDWLLNNATSNDQVVDASSSARKKKQSTSKASDKRSPRDKKSPKKVLAKLEAAPKKKRTKSKNNDASLLSNIEFAQRTDIHPATKRAINEVLGLTTMTEIQARTYDAALTGKDVLGRARTGTGKTIAFLLPAIERLLRTPEYDVNNEVGILIISPTRELATQIGDEAEKLLTFHKSLTVQVVFGGTKTTRDVSRLNKRIPTVLIATPGRLKDLLQTASVGGKRFNKVMSQTPILVLDETDQLLDLGFRREIQQILNYLGSSRKRQTLLFSATVPLELKDIMRQTMEDDYVEVDCIRDGGQSTEQTSINVEQSYAIISSMTQYVPSTIRVVREAANDGDGDNKVVVFFPTARMVSFFANLFNEVVGLPVMELHSKKSQGYRNRVSNQFRECSSGILFTSDVSARGVDYPGVTHVVQFGMPSSKEQYVHRLGRTGRANASGKGWLILANFESLFLEELTKIDIPKNPELIDILNKPTLDEADNIMQSLLQRIQNGDQMLNKSGEGAYQAFLGYYLGQMKRIRMKRKERLVEIANEFSASMGFQSPPVLGGNMVKKMGLDGVAGLLVGKSEGGKGGGRSHTPPKRDGRSRPSSKRRRK